MSTWTRVDRRRFLKLAAGAGTGLVVGCKRRDAPTASQQVPPVTAARAPSASATSTPRAAEPWVGTWVQVDPQGVVSVAIPCDELGQGITTALAMLVAEELGAPWTNVRTRPAPVLPEYGLQATGMSRSVRTRWRELRTAGAVAREMLVAAAAARWSVPTGECEAVDGRVLHPPSQRQATYGDLAPAAAQQAVPTSVELKTPDQWKLIGRDRAALTAADAVAGRTVFGSDLRLPGMLVAVVAHSPIFWGRLEQVDDRLALQVSGVRKVVPIKSLLSHQVAAVAVVADTFWAASEGLRALTIRWSPGPKEGPDSAAIEALYRERARRVGGEKIVTVGDVTAATAQAERTLTAEYWCPFLAHAAMEPMSCTALVRDGSCEVWTATQSPAKAIDAAAEGAGVPSDRVRLHRLIAGGAFGRRLVSDHVFEAVQIAKACSGPVKMLWTRSEDIQHDYYRPATHHQLRVGLRHSGDIVYWKHRFAGKAHQPRVELFADVNAVPYAIPHQLVEASIVAQQVPTGAWRSVARSQNAFATECFLDEVAVATKRDPLELRLALLADAPRAKATLELVAERSGWKRPTRRGRYRGLAMSAHTGSLIAQVAEVSVRPGQPPRVHRVVCAVDCGEVVNPQGVRAQIEGAVAFGLSAALYGEITLAAGAVQESNYHDVPMLRMREMPEVEVHLRPSHEPATGIGELGVPAVAPAVANALFAATGVRARRLPLVPRPR